MELLMLGVLLLGGFVGIIGTLVTISGTLDQIHTELCEIRHVLERTEREVV